MADIPVSTRLLEVYPLLLETELRMHSTEKSCEFDFDTVQLTERLLYLNKSYQNPKVDRIPGYDAWLESLPLTNVFDWSDEELKYLRFKDKRTKLKNRKAAVLKKFTTWTETKRGKESSESYERAMSVILSRAFDTSSRRYIFPYMSFFNHAPANSRENNALYSFGNGKMLVKAAKPIRKGTQLFIDYGPHLSSEAFLYQYDFVPQHQSTHDFVRIPIVLSSGKRGFKLNCCKSLKRKLLSEFGLSEMHIMRRGLANDRSLFISRLLAMTSEDIITKRLHEKSRNDSTYRLPPELELAALKVAVAFASRRIEKSKTTSLSCKQGEETSRKCQIIRLHALELSILKEYRSYSTSLIERTQQLLRKTRPQLRRSDLENDL